MTTSRFENCAAPLRNLALLNLWLAPVSAAPSREGGANRFVTGRIPATAFFARCAAEEKSANGARYDKFYHPADIFRRYAGRPLR